MVFLAVDWLDLLREEGVTSAQFSAGVRHAVKNCSFFPKVADILKGVKAYREAPPVADQSRLQLPDTTTNELTPEEIARNKARVADILKMLSGEMTINEAVESVESKNHIQEFGTKC